MIFKDILMDIVSKKVPEKYTELYYALLLKLIRIYPYAKDENTVEFLNEKTKLVMELIGQCDFPH